MKAGERWERSLTGREVKVLGKLAPGCGSARGALALLKAWALPGWL